MSVASLKSLNVDKMLDIEEAVAMSAEARTLEHEFESLELAVPGWLQTASGVLRAEIERRTHASDLARVREIEAELESYKTTGEKKAEAQKRLAALQKKLGMTASARG
jgi:hypothetical protein